MMAGAENIIKTIEIGSRKGDKLKGKGKKEKEMSNQPGTLLNTCSNREF